MSVTICDISDHVLLHFLHHIFIVFLQPALILQGHERDDDQKPKPACQDQGTSTIPATTPTRKDLGASVGREFD